MVRFLSEIFPASIAPSSERQFVVRAQRESVGRSVGRRDGRTDPRVDRVERSGSFLLFFPLLYSTLLFLIPFFATVTADPFTHTSYVTH